MNKKIVFIIVLVLVLGFVAGYFYGKRGTNDFGKQMGTGIRANIGERNSRFGSMVYGEIISKDENSLTLKLRDGGSKIIFILSSTTVSKMSTTSLNDIVVGSEVSVFGTLNQDGSLNASSIQESPIRPIK